MILNISDVCAFANATPSTRNFLEGEKLLHAGHLLFCGKEAKEDNLINLIAFCIQSSKIKDAPHEIKQLRILMSWTPFPVPTKNACGTILERPAWNNTNQHH
ncbi:uncharacterized protein LOC127289492 [Leptopilina boulardi]|uniref:uncharacterized protein LOC127289492 n=1 Tax=Leptopilina boulardi TaxID=63433 RepID=UPI0021F68AC4|nr:uncharacterized protein LOC127289492 [Leptopilina boulardi]